MIKKYNKFVEDRLVKEDVQVTWRNQTRWLFLR
jgi:hypothetical protein